jgi:hypothetical protein
MNKMQLEINKMIESENSFIKRLGWFLYDQNGLEKGLSSQATKELIELFSTYNVSREEEKVWDKAYNEGYKDAEEELTRYCDCYC